MTSGKELRTGRSDLNRENVSSVGVFQNQWVERNMCRARSTDEIYGFSAIYTELMDTAPSG